MKKEKKVRHTQPETLVEGEDYYFNQAGLMVFTKSYHLKRGFCCQSGCLNCPWEFRKKETPE